MVPSSGRPGGAERVKGGLINVVRKEGRFSFKDNKELHEQITTSIVNGEMIGSIRGIARANRINEKTLCNDINLRASDHSGAGISV